MSRRTEISLPFPLLNGTLLIALGSLLVGLPLGLASGVPRRDRRTLRLLDGLVEDEWDRSGVHQQRGVVTVASIVKTLAEHDRSHLDQIRHALA